MLGFRAKDQISIEKIEKLAQTASHREQLTREALALLKTVIPFNSGVFFDINPATLECTGAHLENLDKDFLSLYFQKFYRQQDSAIALQGLLRRGRGCARGSDMIAPKSFMNSALYTELLNPFACHSFLAVAFVDGPECHGHLILWRNPFERDFQKKHVEFMRTVSPIIARGLKAHPIRSEAAEAVPAGASMLAQIINKRSPPGILILDRMDQVLYKNEPAQNILYLLSKSWANNGADGNLQAAALPAEITKLCGALRSSSSKNIDQARQIACLTSTVSFGSEVYSLRALPLEKDGGRADEYTTIIVLIENISHTQRLDLEKARDRYHLTFKEKEVVQLLIQGCTNKEVARELSIGAYTVKDHLKNIRQKMGADSRIGILSKIIQSH